MPPPKLDVGQKGGRHSQPLGKLPDREILVSPDFPQVLAKGLHVASGVSLQKRLFESQGPMRTGA